MAKRSWQGCLAVLVLVFAAALFALKKAHEALRPMNTGANHGNLGALRSALSIYYGDMEGLYPETPAELMVNDKYLQKISAVRTMDHPDSDEVTFFPSVRPLDSGTWGYVNNPYSEDWGKIFVDCTHTDNKGQAWHAY